MVILKLMLKRISNGGADSQTDADAHGDNDSQAGADAHGDADAHGGTDSEAQADDKKNPPLKKFLIPASILRSIEWSICKWLWLFW